MEKSNVMMEGKDALQIFSCPPLLIFFSKGGVNCGIHKAASCKECTGELRNKNYARYWCKGDCSWRAGKCSIKEKKPKQSMDGNFHIFPTSIQELDTELTDIIILIWS